MNSIQTRNMLNLAVFLSTHNTPKKRIPKNKGRQPHKTNEIQHSFE